MGLGKTVQTAVFLYSLYKEVRPLLASILAQTRWFKCLTPDPLHESGLLCHMSIKAIEFVAVAAGRTSARALVLGVCTKLLSYWLGAVQPFCLNQVKSVGIKFSL